MESIAKLIPDLGLWNFGNGISPSDWIFAEGRADQALSFCELLWPEISSFESYVLREPINMDNLRGWENGGRNRQQTELGMNAYLIEDIFPQDSTAVELKGKQIACLANFMVEMLTAKLAITFPDRSFSVVVIDDDDDFGVSFYQC